MSLRLLYELADRTDCVATTLLDNLVIVVIPVQNPDGREADTRRNAYGFDLNRDVFARTQPETDSRVELMRTYPPVLLLDDHEFGYYRSFFPPDADPVYHEVSETSMRWIEDVYGAAISRQFRKEGEVFFHGGIYDFFAPQYNDTGSAFGFGAAGMTIEVYNGAAARPARASALHGRDGVALAGGQPPRLRPAGAPRDLRGGGRRGARGHPGEEPPLLQAEPSGPHPRPHHTRASLLHRGRGGAQGRRRASSRPAAPTDGRRGVPAPGAARGPRLPSVRTERPPHAPARRARSGSRWPSRRSTGSKRSSTRRRTCPPRTRTAWPAGATRCSCRSTAATAARSCGLARR